MIAVDTSGGQIPDPLQTRRMRDLVRRRVQHRIALGRRGSRYQQVRNDRIKDELGVTLKYATYQDVLQAMLDTEQN